MAAVLRVLLVLAWLAGSLAALDHLSDAVLLGAFAAGVAVGAVIDRWWALAVPVGVGVALLIWALIDGGPVDSYDVLGIVVILVSLTIGAVIPLALGVGIRRLVGYAPQPD